MKKIFLQLKSWWMKFAHAVGWFNTRLLLTAVYFVIFALPAIILKIIRKDLLNRRWNTAIGTYWKTKPQSADSIEKAKHQF
jgi:hypothetical protein